MSGTEKNKGQGAVSNIQRLSKLGRRTAGMESNRTAPADESLIASLYLKDGAQMPSDQPELTPMDDSAAAFESQNDDVPVRPGYDEPAPSPSAERPVDYTATESGTVEPGAATDVSRRPSKKAMIVAISILVLTAVAFMRSCGNEPDKAPVATKPVDVTTPWVRLESNDVKPLDTVIPGPEAAVGVEREKQIPKMLESLNKPEPPVSAVPVIPDDKKGPENTERTRELEARVESLTKEIQELKVKKTEKPLAKPRVTRTAPPSVKILAIARTEKCLSCPLFALLDVDGKTLQLASGDKIKDYIVAVSTDRVVLSRGKENLTFYSIMAP